MDAGFKDLYTAVEINNFGEVKEILSTNPELIKGKDKYGFTLLHAAVMTENVELLEYLLEKGADVNAQNSMGISPLHIVLYEEAAECLLDNGARIDLASLEGNTPLHEHAANGEDSIEIISLLLNRGGRTDISNKSGQIPLDIAKKRGETEIIKILKKDKRKFWGLF